MATAVRPLRALCAVGALCVLCGSVVKNPSLNLLLRVKGDFMYNRGSIILFG
jgi:hypothetical protein